MCLVSSETRANKLGEEQTEDEFFYSYNHRLIVYTNLVVVLCYLNGWLGEISGLIGQNTKTAVQMKKK